MTEPPGGDAEIRALEAVFAALNPLDDEARSRVLDYTLKRLGMREVPAASAILSDGEAIDGVHSPEDRAESTSRTDIRSLKDEKAPGSGIEMVALVAYYLAEHAPPDERKD